MQSVASSFKNIITSGAVVNFLLVILGSTLGLILKKGISEKVQKTLISAMALCVIYIGITGFFEDGIKILVVIISMALGSVIGETIDFEKAVNRLGDKLEAKFKSQNGGIATGFVTATLLFCVGAMTVVGSFESGINGDNTTLYSKSVIDCVSAIALTSSLGLGVMLSCVSVLFIEGGLTLLSVLVSPILTTDIITQMTVIGSILIVALGLNMLGITKIKVMNCLPAIFLPLILCLFM